MVFYVFFQIDEKRHKNIATRKINHSSKNKSHKKLTRKFVFAISISVTKVTAFETDEGIGERSREALGESKGRAVCTCY